VSSLAPSGERCGQGKRVRFATWFQFTPQARLAVRAFGDCGVIRDRRSSSGCASLRRPNAHSACTCADLRSSDKRPLGNFRRCSSTAFRAFAACPACSSLVARDKMATSSAKRPPSRRVASTADSEARAGAVGSDAVERGDDLGAAVPGSSSKSRFWGARRIGDSVTDVGQAKRAAPKSVPNAAVVKAAFAHAESAHSDRGGCISRGSTTSPSRARSAEEMRSRSLIDGRNTSRPTRTSCDALWLSAFMRFFPLPSFAAILAAVRY